MVYRFLILSDEVDDFKREIKINSDATFLDLHQAIQDATGFKGDEMASFFLCDDDWTKETEITLVEMDTSSEVDAYVMEDTPLEELVEDEHQKLLYVFDYMMDRSFFIELVEMITGQTLRKPVCSLSVGEPPAQTVSPEEMDKRIEKFELDENFYEEMGLSEDDMNVIDDDEFEPDNIENYFNEDRFG
ncbi:MAG: plasmid pRiA4b ORF-3 family protein [Tannerella sp.]|jgi:hypothetical protein|nr:plasmid pRiA4b ORF-3 family protein [Tannerella sp.]